MNKSEILATVSAAVPYAVQWADQARYLCDASRILEVLDVPVPQQRALLGRIENLLPKGHRLRWAEFDTEAITIMFCRSRNKPVGA